MNNCVESRLETLALIEEEKIALRIPSYQRPYVWSEDDVLKLLDDIVAAFENNEPHYYIGTVFSSWRQLAYELVDGQQRMTTLMLMALAFSKVYPESQLKNLVVLKRQPRLTFAIREQVQTLLAHWSGLADDPAQSAETIIYDDYQRPLYSAYKALINRFAVLHDASPDQLTGLSDFIYRKVKWVNNVAPTGMDTNRMFTTMNTGGMQLEQSDILKSALLKKITRDKYQFDAIWQACENMGNYFERNLRKLFPAASWRNLKYKDLAEYTSEIFPLNKPERHGSQGKSIAELAASRGRKEDEAVAMSPSVDDTDVYCRSTISFSLLLIHALRIFRHSRGEEDIDTRVIDTQLNLGFAEFIRTAKEKDVKEFLRVLWRVRHQFDLWCVKWVRADAQSEEHLCVTSVRFDKTKGRLSRQLPEKISDLVQLQSVRNFSGERSAQYWLTAFIGALLAQPHAKQQDAETLLEDIDNQLSLTRYTQKAASFILIDKNCDQQRDINEICDYLAEPKGTSFEHYWFQKLEYVLWSRRSDLFCFNQEKLDRYRITSKNSVEHVHPQNEEHGSRLGNADLHAFGNLVLLSPGENSSYSNKAVPVKREDFYAKPRYDALKLALIFDKKKHKDWNAQAIDLHQKEMLQFLRMHYS